MVYLGKRQDNDFDSDPYDDDGWWYSDTAEAIKWAVVAFIFLAIILFFAGGYLHAQRRMKRGQAPLRYHRWLLPRSQRLRYAPQQQFTFYHHQQNPYEMQPYPPPPPAYHHNEMPPPPQYEPPQGASKTNPDQRYTAPLGPPPAGEMSRSGPVSPISPIQGRGEPLREHDAFSPQNDQAQLPPRPEPSNRSWNPLKRFR
ncbi:MAG: hypothetical protein L6R41_005424 [Letrouitia leprolyta]|nr:MAG: hypothetical protein L6R41_005424 [Letrouitia leprolyta]